MMPHAQDVIRFFLQDEEALKRVQLQAQDVSPVSERIERPAEHILSERRNEVNHAGKIPPSPLFIP